MHNLQPKIILEPAGGFRQLQTTAVQTLIYEGIVGLNEDQAIVVTRLVRRITYILLLEEELWNTVYHNAETILHTKLTYALKSQDSQALTSLLPQARAIIDRAISRTSSLAYELCSVLGKALLFLGRPEAEYYLHCATECYEAVPYGPLRSYLGLLSLLVALCLAKKDIQGASSYLRRMMNASQQELGPTHPLTLKAQAGLARLLSEIEEN